MLARGRPVFDAHRPLYDLGELYLLVLLLRAVLSWFPVQPRSALSSINHWLYVLTEPLIAPVRRMVPPMGIFDVAYLIVFLLVYVFTAFVLHLVRI